VDCGSCNCPTPCGECLVCQSGPNTPGTCVPDPEQVGDPCGSDGQVCQADGSCACDAGSCTNPTPVCANGACVACSAMNPCPSGCCDLTTGACLTTCPTCQTCAAGQCVADASQDRSCCAGPAGEQWCQSGACVPIPGDARATLAECTGRCDCVPYSGDGCFGGTPAYQEICGATRLCPLCEQCTQLVAGCVGTTIGDGPGGVSFYCLFGGNLGSCTTFESCPDPAVQACLGQSVCDNICGVATP
jgi:hypothetical protein